MKSGQTSPGDHHDHAEESYDEEQFVLTGHEAYQDHFLGDSESVAGSEEGDYTESDSEGEESYKKGGYHPVRIGEIYNNRYRIVCKLGWGHFSTVWLAQDMHGTRSTGQLCYVALKVQKSASHYTEAAYDEIELLTRARNSRNDNVWQQARQSYVSNHLCPDAKGDPEYTGVVSLCDYFETVGPNGVHVCMVFETMGPNVLTLIKKFDFKGVPLNIVKKLTADCLVGLDYLHRVCGIIHTDLKPENVLVSCPLGVPVNKSGEPLVPLNEPIDATGLHFADLPARSGKKAEPIAPIPPETTHEQSSRKTLTRNQRRRLNRKKKLKEKREVVSSGVTSINSSPTATASLVERKELVSKNKKKRKGKNGRHNYTEEASTAERDLKAPWPDPPFVRNRLKPSRSDPTLLSHYGPQQVGPRKMPYHHPRSTFAKAQNLAKELRSVASMSTATSAAAVSTEHVRESVKKAAEKRSSVPSVTHDRIRELDLFSHESASFKIADLGNACWVDRHFSEEIQTRQYRSPEVLIGSGYDTSADIWSLACMVFELVTGDYLFDPKGSDEYPRDEDHLALMIELLGPIPSEMIAQGKRSATFFNRRGELRHIKQLRYWGLADVLMQKYRLSSLEAAELANFLAPMLAIDPRNRVTAQQLLSHSWLKIENAPAPVVDLWFNGDDEADRASEVILNSPGYSSARSEAI
jgi:serine/threonine-protein kinase SRPK3